MNAQIQRLVDEPMERTMFWMTTPCLLSYGQCWKDLYNHISRWLIFQYKRPWGEINVTKKTSSPEILVQFVSVIHNAIFWEEWKICLVISSDKSLSYIQLIERKKYRMYVQFLKWHLERGEKEREKGRSCNGLKRLAGQLRRRIKLVSMKLWRV